MHIFLRGKNKMVNLMFSHCCSLHLRLSGNSSCHCDTSVREPQRALPEADCPGNPLPLERAAVVVRTEGWGEYGRLGFPPNTPGPGEKGQCSELLHSIDSRAQHSYLWARLTQSASRCWEFKQWIEGAAWLSADFPPSKLGLWSQRTASNKNQFPLYSKESS